MMDPIQWIGFLFGCFWFWLQLKWLLNWKLFRIFISIEYWAVKRPDFELDFGNTSIYSPIAMSSRKSETNLRWWQRTEVTVRTHSGVTSNFDPPQDLKNGPQLPILPYMAWKWAHFGSLFAWAPHSWEPCRPIVTPLLTYSLRHKPLLRQEWVIIFNLSEYWSPLGIIGYRYQS